MYQKFKNIFKKNLHERKKFPLVRQLKAFTLIEMLIVITIIGFIAFLGISAYGGAQKQAKLEFAADTIVSLIRQQQSLAKSGRSHLKIAEKNGGSKKCYGIVIVPQKIALVETKYFPLKNNQADVCDLTTLEERPLSELQDFEITTLEQDSQSVEELLILFKPPNGKTLLGNKAELFSTQNNLTSEVRIGITARQEDKEKIILFSPPTGFIERIEEEKISI